MKAKLEVERACPWDLLCCAPTRPWAWAGPRPADRCGSLQEYTLPAAGGRGSGTGQAGRGGLRPGNSFQAGVCVPHPLYSCSIYSLPTGLGLEVSS